MQVALRDKEVDRLQHLLEGGRPTKAIVNDGMKDSTDRVISHLNMQVPSWPLVTCSQVIKSLCMFWGPGLIKMYENCIFCFLNKGMKQLFNFNLYSCYPSQQIKDVVIHWWGKEINIKQYVFLFIECPAWSRRPMSRRQRCYSGLSIAY